MPEIQLQKVERVAEELVKELDQPMQIGKARITPAEGIVRSCIREGIPISDKDWVLAEMASVSGGSFSPGEVFPQPEAVKKALEKYWPEIVGKLKKAAKQVEQQMATEEKALLGWKYLVARKHSWRRQAYIKGSNMTVGQLISIIKTNNLTPSEASSNLRLPLEKIEEALRYYEQNRTLIEQEAEKERLRLKKKGYTLEPQDLPR
jgi:uncharacterized protein (DUF433 family)